GAQTGTGKTAAFALPILQRLAPQASSSASPARHPVRALILAPTRELAIQVAQSFAEYGKNLPLRSTVVYGGVDMNAQIAQLRKPAELQIAARNAAAELVTHVLHPVAREKKRELLAYLIQTRELRQVLVFTGTRIGANRLAHQLRRDHIHADAIHGDKSQAERLVALEGFKSGKTNVLVATDVASRGLDIEGLPQVINFDMPHSSEDYIHRIGRTGRAGLTGEAISLVAPEDLESIAAIEKLIKKRIERVLVPGFQPSAATVATLMGGEPSRPPRRDAKNTAESRTV